MPKVCVVMPARNAAATVERAVRSILEQTLGDLRLLAIDDGSTDGTLGRLEALADEDARVEVLSTPPRGLVAALNDGLSRCDAPYLARMDADDESLPQRLERSVAALEANPALAAVGTQVELFRDDRPASPNMQAYAAWLSGLTEPSALFHDRFVESPLCHPSITARRARLEEVGGWEDGDFPEDYQLWLKLLERGHALCAVPQVLFRWRDHDQRLTRQDARYTLPRHAWLKARFLARGPLRQGRCIVWGAGETGLKLMRLLRAEGVAVERLIELSPRKIGQRIDGVPVESPGALGPPGAAHLVAAVGAKGARAEIRAFLRARRWREGEHFTCAA